MNETTNRQIDRNLIKMNLEACHQSTVLAVELEIARLKTGGTITEVAIMQSTLDLINKQARESIDSLLTVYD